MEHPGRLARAMSLRQATSVVFALVAIVPILLLVYLLSRAGWLDRLEAQIGLAGAVLVSALGFFVLRRMTDQIGRLAQGLRAPAAGADAGSPGEAVRGDVPGLGQVAEIG